MIPLFASVAFGAPALAAPQVKASWKRSPKFINSYYVSEINPQFACSVSGSSIVNFKTVRSVVFVTPAFRKQNAKLVQLRAELRKLRKSGNLKGLARTTKRIETLKATLAAKWDQFCARPSTPTPTATPIGTQSPVPQTPSPVPTTVPEGTAIPTSTATPTSTPTPIPDSVSLEPYTGPLTRYDLFTLVNKALYGPDYTDYGGGRWQYDMAALESYFAANGLEKTVDLITTWTEPTAAEKEILQYVTYTNRGGPISFPGPRNIRFRTTLLAAGSNPFHVRIWQFLYGLWTVSGEQWRDTSLADLQGPYYYDTLYRLAQNPDLDIHVMLPEAMNHPAMVKFLDRDGSTRTIKVGDRYLAAANENFGREQMELFTMGTHRFTEAENPDGTCVTGSPNYTDVDTHGDNSDIAKVSQIWSGWVVKPWIGSGTDHRYRIEFNPANGPIKAETIFEGTSHQRTVSTPAELMEATLAHPNAPLFFAHELVREFVHHNPPCPLVHQVAASIVKHDFKLKPVILEIFRSKAFYHKSNRFKSVKPALDMYVSMIRLLGLNVFNAFAPTYLDKLQSVWDGIGQQYSELDLVQPVQYPSRGVFYYDYVPAFHSYGAMHAYNAFAVWNAAAYHLYPPTYREDGKLVAPHWLAPKGSSPAAFLVNLFERIGVPLAAEDEISADVLERLLFFLENRRNADGSYTRISSPFIGTTIDSIYALRAYWMIMGNTHYLQGR